MHLASPFPLVYSSLQILLLVIVHSMLIACITIGLSVSQIVPHLTAQVVLYVYLNPEQSVQLLQLSQSVQFWQFMQLSQSEQFVQLLQLERFLLLWQLELEVQCVQEVQLLQESLVVDIVVSGGFAAE